jgi:hypothetical protein
MKSWYDYNVMRNLKIPESGIGFMIFLIFSFYKITPYINFKNYKTNCNMLIINEYDNYKNTKGKVTFIPLDFLYNYYKINKDDKIHQDIPINNIDTLEIKTYLYNFLLNDLEQKKICNYEFITTNSYKGILLIFFRKPYMRSSFSKNKDFSMIKDIRDDINNYQNGFVNASLQKAIDSEIRKDEWMSSIDISNVIFPLLKLKQNNDIYYIELLNFPVKHTDAAMVNSGFKTYYKLADIKPKFKDFIESKKRYLLAIMLYDSHFTCLIYDRYISFPNESKNGICYIFNSGGYDPCNIKYNSNILFIDSNMAVKKFKNLNINFSETSHISYNNIDVIVELFKHMFRVDTFILNTFTIQKYYSECGMFCTLFLYLFIIDKNKNMHSQRSILPMKKIYFAMSFFGDLLTGYMRGSMYVNNEDSPEIPYKKRLDVFKLCNKKIREFEQIYIKNSYRLQNAARHYESIFGLLNLNEFNKYDK